MLTVYDLQFYFTRSEDIRRNDVSAKMLHPLRSRELYTDYFDSFNCECRAYGRLKEEGREDLAVRAHGYILLTIEQEDDVTKMILAGEPDPQSDMEDDIMYSNIWKRSIDFEYGDEHSDLLLRGIVKDLATDPDPFRPEHVDGMWKDLQDLNKLGILVRDVHPHNYVGGKLVDFSRAWVSPHPAIMHLPESEVLEQRRLDPHQLREAFLTVGAKDHWDWDKVKIPKELNDVDSHAVPIDTHCPDPDLYDWHKWEPDEHDADDFMAAILGPARRSNGVSHPRVPN